MKIDHIFPIPIATDKIDPVLINDTLLKVNNFIAETNFCNPASPGELLTTFYKDKDFLGKIGCYDLLNLINLRTREFFKLIGLNPQSFIEITSWLQYNQPGSYFVRHDHYAALVSGCVYLQTPENGGAIQFHSPLETRRCTSAFFERVKQEENEYNFSHVKYFPVSGDLLMFEPWLQHTVQQNKSNDPRISIGFNIWADIDVKS